MKKFKNAPILDPDNYDPNDYENDQQIRFKEGDKFVNAVITDIDYTNGNVAVEFYRDDDDIADDEIKI